MNKSIINIINIEKEIARLYGIVRAMELSEEKNCASFGAFSNALENSVLEENNLFYNLSGNDLLLLSDKEKLASLIGNFDTDYDIESRILNRIDYINTKKAFKEVNDIVVADAIISDKQDIFLSFMDEEIEKANDYDRNILIFAKYNCIYSLDLQDEKRVISRNFSTDKSLYLCSKLCADLNRTPRKMYEIYKTSVAFSILSNINEKIKSADQYLSKILLLTIRTYMIMTSDYSYNALIDKLSSNKELSNLFNSSFDCDFVDLVKKDKERHKVLSLAP